MIIKKVVTGNIAENCWIIGNEQTKTAIIIDPGDDANKIIDAINDLKLEPLIILNTHGHPDHIGAASDIQDKFDILFRIHKEEKNVMEVAAPMAKMLGFENFRLPKVSSFISEENIIIEGFNVKVLFTPGHSPGGVCFLIGEHLFSGDTLFYRSIGRTDLPGGDWNSMSNSLRKLSKLPENTKVYPGHGLETTIREELNNNQFMQDLF